MSNSLYSNSEVLFTKGATGTRETTKQSQGLNRSDTRNGKDEGSKGEVKQRVVMK